MLALDQIWTLDQLHSNGCVAPFHPANLFIWGLPQEWELGLEAVAIGVINL